jgi:cytoskeletal protein RodZ
LGTRMSPSYLIALERDDFEYFSQKEYIEGFLKSYARFLGLDPRGVLKRYRIQAELASRREVFRQLPLFDGETVAEVESQPTEALARPPATKSSGRYSWSRTFFQVAILAAALGLSFYIWNGLKPRGDIKKTPTGKQPVSQETQRNLPGDANNAAERRK